MLHCKLRLQGRQLWVLSSRLNVLQLKNLLEAVCSTELAWQEAQLRSCSICKPPPQKGIEGAPSGAQRLVLLDHSFHSWAVAFDSKPLKAHPSANFQRRPPGNKTAWARPGDPPAENLLLSLWVSICSRQLRPGVCSWGAALLHRQLRLTHWPRGRGDSMSPGAIGSLG